MAPRETLPPCSVTGRPCVWLSDETYDEATGEMTSWTDFCRDCGEERDFSKDECPDPGTCPA